MAENEILDTSGFSGRKWRKLIDDIHNGVDRDAIGTKAISAFRLTLKQFLKASEARGVSLAALLEARDSPARLKQLFSTSGKLDCVRIFMETARAEAGSDGESLLASCLENMMDRIEDQIVQHFANTAEGRGLIEIDRVVKLIRRPISEDIQAMAHRLNDDPSWRPRKNPDRAAASMDSTDQLLGVSLLRGRQP